ncbi:MAG: type VI secretion system membrane subunit TssM [bacterium]
MSKFIALLRNPQFLLTSLAMTVLALLVLICAIAGLGFKEILLILLTIAVIWNVYFLVKQRRDGKKSAELEASLSQQAEDQIYSTRPDKRDDIEALKTKLDKAISALKESRLGKGKGSAALYTLPWYMIIGPPGSGKSTALRYSELEFPYVDPESKDHKVRGLGGTKNCDFWFTTDGILLDTAGRYVMPMAQAEDRQEWQEFLNHLKKHRRKMPINGVIVAVSIAEQDDKFFGILTSDATQIERHAKNIRARIDELIKTLEIEFPIYLVFTKCDLLTGFVEFFEDMEKADRNQVWGYTLPKSQWQNRKPQEIFKLELKHLYRHLSLRRMAQLAAERKTERKRKIYLFPLEFYAARKKLSLFIEKLFEYNRYLDNPVFRGFYFTSGTQVGNPIDRVVSNLATELGFTAKVFHEQPAETKSYFIKSLLDKVIFPDQGLVSTSSLGEKRSWLLRLGMSAAAVLVFLALLLGMASGFRANDRLLKDVARTTRTVEREVTNRFEPNDLFYLETLRRQVLRLEKGPSFRQRLVTYPGDKVKGELKALYFKKWTRSILTPLYSLFEQRLRTLPTARTRPAYLRTLKMYLILTGACEVEQGTLARELAQVWSDEFVPSQPDTLKGLARTQFAYYLGHLGAEPDRYILVRTSAGDDLVARARAALRQAPPTEILFSQLQEQANRDLSYDPLPGGQNALRSGGTMQPVFTRQGWEEVMAPALTNLSAVSPQGDCVLGNGAVEIDPANARQTTSQVYTLYLNQYKQAWQNIVRNATIQDFSTLKEAATGLGVLSGQDSPMVKFFTEVAEQTQLAGFQNYNGVALASVRSEFRAVHQLTATPEGADGQSSPLQLYIAELAKVQAAVQTLADADAPGSEAKLYAQTVLNRSGDELTSAWNTTEQILRTLDPGSSAALRPLLMQPLDKTWRVVLAAAKGHLKQLWQTQVYAFYRQKLAGKYPFADSRSEAFLAEVVSFFKPDNGILWGFYTAHLSDLIDAGTWRPRSWNGGSLVSNTAVFREADKITRSLFPDGTPQPFVSFELEPRLPQAAQSYCLALRYYGDNLTACAGALTRWSLQWPRRDGEQRVIFRVYKEDNKARTQRLVCDGEWALFRFLDYATTRSWQGNQLLIQWRLSGTRVNAPVGFSLRPTSSREVFQPGFFAAFRCPSGL